MPGTITYEKSRDELTDHERACVDWLAYNGISTMVKLEDPNAPANIDLEIDGKPWEMKNVTNVSSSVGNQLRRVRRKWWKLHLPAPTRAVFTSEDATDDFDAIVNALATKKRDDELFWVISESGELREI